MSCVDSSCLQPSTGTAGAAFQAALQFFALQQCLIPEKYPVGVIKDGDTFDFIVVGAGTSGATLAARLAEVSQWKVLLVEAGGTPPVESTIPDFASSLAGTQYDWADTTFDQTYSPQRNKTLKYTRGKMLGGGSSLNGMVYVRGHPDDFNMWAAYGNKGWDWESVLPYFIKSESMTDVSVFKSSKNAPLHNTQGPVRYSRPGFLEEINKDLLSAYEEIGIPRQLETNGPKQIGITLAHLAVFNGTRQSTAEAFLKNASKNLVIATNTLATKILFDESEQTAIGVELLLESGKSMNVYASSDVISSAGVLGSPQLLLLSGIGPKNDLENLGIPVRGDLPVGENFSTHLAITIYFTGPNNTVTLADTYFRQVQYLYDRTGPLGGNPVIIGFYNANDDDPKGRPNYQINNFYASSSTTGTASCALPESACRSLNAIPPNTKLYRTTVVYLHPKARGKVSLRTNVPTDKPFIRTGLFSDDVDINTLALGVGRLKGLADTSYFKSLNSKLVQLDLPECNHLEFQSHDYWKCYILILSDIWRHAVGTCSMRPDGVVDAGAKVRGFSKLRIVDQSVVPLTISGNTNAVALLVAEKVADIIKAEYGVL